MTLKRSKLEIYVDILKVISRGTNKPTRIMYKTNLSWKPLMLILNSMLEQDLVAENEENTHKTYIVTQKGKNILQYFEQGMKMIEIE